MRKVLCVYTSYVFVFTPETPWSWNACDPLKLSPRRIWESGNPSGKSVWIPNFPEFNGWIHGWVKFFEFHHLFLWVIFSKWTNQQKHPGKSTDGTPKNGGLVQMIFLFNWVNLMFPAVNFHQKDFHFEAPRITSLLLWMIKWYHTGGGSGVSGWLVAIDIDQVFIYYAINQTNRYMYMYIFVRIPIWSSWFRQGLLPLNAWDMFTHGTFIGEISIDIEEQSSKLGAKMVDPPCHLIRHMSVSSRTMT